MSEKIGFIRFDAFDLQKVEEYRALRNQRINQRKVLSIYEMLPTQPPWKAIGEICDDPHIRLRFTQELQPYMEQYYEHFYKAAVNREVLERWFKRQRDQVYHAHADWQRLGLLEEWLQQRMAINAYAELGRMRSLFRKAHLRSWMSEAQFAFVAQDVAGNRMIRTAEHFGHLIHDRLRPVALQASEQNWRPLTKDTTEHEQVFATQIKGKSRKWMQLQAAASYAATSAAAFQDVNEGIVSPPALTHGFGMKIMS